MNGKKYKIKPLEWVQYAKEENNETHQSRPCGNYYAVVRNKNKYWWAGNGQSWMTRTTCKSIEDGKAKAEADWLARILPALEEVKEGES